MHAAARMDEPPTGMDDLHWRILTLVAKRGYIGATREDFFREIRGVIYDDLEKAILSLEKDGYVSLEWLADHPIIQPLHAKGSRGRDGECDRGVDAYPDPGASPRSRLG